jgi:hypothetical protein
MIHSTPKQLEVHTPPHARPGDRPFSLKSLQHTGSVLTYEASLSVLSCSATLFPKTLRARTFRLPRTIDVHSHQVGFRQGDKKVACDRFLRQRLSGRSSILPQLLLVALPASR